MYLDLLNSSNSPKAEQIIVIITTATITTTPGGKGMVLLSPAKAVLQIFFLLYETNHCEYHGMLVFLKLNE